MSIKKMRAMKTELSDWFAGRIKVIIEIVLVVISIDIFYE
jgi:hypothetical protein